MSLGGVQSPGPQLLRGRHGPRLGSRTWVGGIGVNSQSWDMEGNAESGGLHQATDKLSAKGLANQLIRATPRRG